MFFPLVICACLPGTPSVLHVLFGCSAKVSFAPGGFSLTGCFLLLLCSVLLCRDLGFIIRVEGTSLHRKKYVWELPTLSLRKENVGIVSWVATSPFLYCVCFPVAQIPITSNTRRKDTVWIAVWGYNSSWPGRHGGLGAVATVAGVAGGFLTCFWTSKTEKGELQVRLPQSVTFFC